MEVKRKYNIGDKVKIGKELNDRLYPKFSISSGKVFDFNTVELGKERKEKDE